MTAPLERLCAALSDRYAIERQVGVGGMATVYLARDLRHDRRVALKVLRPELGAVIGAERFLAEIRTTAKLQHPHILPLFDSGEADGLLYYVMPYVEGVSLRDRLNREKQLPVAEAVRIASEVASALDYAHRHGVIHRDIKPENVLLHDGQALVADFGIALAVSNAGATRMTETGMSLGTPHYMSPEQAMGEREITERSDVYALGAVTYEMLTGEPPFTGPTAQSIVAKVVTEEPRPLIPKRRTIPPHVERAVLTALEKLPADRFASAAEFAAVLRTPSTATPGRPAAARAAGIPGSYAIPRNLIGGAVVAVVLLATAFGAGRWSGAAPAAAVPVGRFIISSASDHQFTGFGFRGVALSPDGQTLVYLAQNARGLQLYQRRLDQLTSTPIQGTEGGFNPLFTPDGRWIVFWQGNALKKIALSGGAPINVPVGDVAPVEAVWMDDGTLVATSLDGSLHRIAPSGESTLITARGVDEAGLNVVGVLPRGRVLAIAATQTVGGGSAGRLHAIDVRSGGRTLLMDPIVVGAAYHDGFLVWTQPDGAMLAAPFDAGALRLAGTPVSIAQGVRIAVGGPAQFAVSNSGTLAYMPEVPFDLRLVGRDGRGESVVNVQRRFHSPRFSPDGRRIAVDFVHSGSRDVWTMDLRQRNLSRLTFDNDGHDPVWTPDGRRVAYATARGGVIGMFVRSADGSGAADSLHVGRMEHTIGAFLPDGERAIVMVSGPTGYDLYLMSVVGERTLEPLLATPFNEYYPAVSPDGRWLAYVSDESGQSEVYVRSLSGTGAKTLVSESGGSEPVWSRNGRELYYRGFGPQGVPLVAVSVRTAPDFQVLARTNLFDVTEYEAAVPHANFDVSPDGRFLMVYQGRLSEMVLVQNWPQEVRRLSAMARK